MGEERLAKGQNFLNEREQRANENDRICSRKERDLIEAQKSIDATNITLRNKEDDVNSRLANISLKEKISKRKSYLDFELRKEELEADMQNQLEQKEKT
ncbi:hypothetical protein RJT34_13332 [Clitoria ternatea]|uniref:Uncharacterized protein n=1 Tax=Clitoria ternatea TaxID=43366 RepID=A0AAN9JNR5_CLITE